MGWTPVARSTGVRVELAVGSALLSVVCAFGIAVAGDDRPTGIDRWGFALVPHEWRNPLWVEMVRLGSPIVVGVLIVVGALVALRRGRQLAAVCVLGPVVAVMLTQVAKYAFDRQYGGVRSYPSGTVVVVAALATVTVEVPVELT